MKLALVGASGGIGEALLPLLAGKYECVGTSSALLDITDALAVKRWMEANQPEIIINAAVVNVDAMIHKCDPLKVERQTAVTVRGLTNLLRYGLPAMRERGWGRFIHLSSVLAKVRMAGVGVYAAGKAYGEHICRIAAVENCGKGVTVNCLRLGYFNCGLQNKIDPGTQARILDMIPAGRWGRVEEIAATIDFLVATEYVNGVCVDLTGGL